jgi:hypothetical protein
MVDIEAVRSLVGIAKENKLVSLEVEGIRLVFSPHAHAPAIMPEREKTPEEIKREEDALLYHSAGG